MASGSSSRSTFVPAKHSHHLVAPMKQASDQSEPLYVVIAPSPNTLLNGSRYLCEACFKGFPREQNLTLHRRVHNLPFSLKRRSSAAAKPPGIRKLYLCPEPTCQHHDHSHALGDFGGLKKHYLRKHCTEKNYHCEICSRMYAAETDLKAHLKVCRKRKQPIKHRGAQFARGNNFVAHNEAVAGHSSTLQMGDTSREINTSSNNNHLIGNSTIPYAPTFYVGEPSMRSSSSDNPSSLIGSTIPYAPTFYVREPSTRSSTSSDNPSSLVGLYASHPDPHISAMQNLSKSYLSAARDQSQLCPFGIDNGSLMTDPFISSNSGQMFLDFFSPSSTQQNQHRLQADFDSRSYTDLLMGKIPLDNMNLMGDDRNIYGNGEGPSSNTINGGIVEHSSSHNLISGIHNPSLNGIPNPVYGGGPSTFNQEFDGSYDQGSNYAYGMEVSNNETSPTTAGVVAPYGQILDPFRGFWF